MLIVILIFILALVIAPWTYSLGCHIIVKLTKLGFFLDKYLDYWAWVESRY